MTVSTARTKTSPTQGVHNIIMHSTRLPFRTECSRRTYENNLIDFHRPSYCRVFLDHRGGVPIQMISQWSRTANINGLSPQTCGACKYDVILYTGIRNCLGNHNVGGRGPVVLPVGRLLRQRSFNWKKKRKRNSPRSKGLGEITISPN